MLIEDVTFGSVFELNGVQGYICGMSRGLCLAVMKNGDMRQIPFGIDVKVIWQQTQKCQM